MLTFDLTPSAVAQAILTYLTVRKKLPELEGSGPFHTRVVMKGDGGITFSVEHAPEGTETSPCIVIKV